MTPRRGAAAVALAALAACSSEPTQDQIDAANNTFICDARGERIVIRFDTGEARVLLANGERMTLYQIATGSGVRFSNGLLELRGKGTELTLIRDGFAITLDECHNPPLPKPK
jgi:membrane-bound inhibitor of C-type lysozyme